MSAEGKWTPGPWAQSHRKTRDGMYSTEVYDAKGETIATLAWHVVPTENGYATDREANARLIASAPDMAEALREICKGSIDVSHTAIIIGPDALAALTRARATLAKAGGHSHHKEPS